jgi:predicted PurR-regulated permease PerM
VGIPAAPGPPEAAAQAAEERLEAQVRRASAAWRRLGRRLRTVTSSALVRFLLTLVAVYAVVWLIRVTWPALLPFAAGGVIAYTVMPLADALDRVMPRPLAAVLTMALVLAAVVGVLGVIIPPLAEQLYRLYLSLPAVEDVQGMVEQLRGALGALPAPVQDAIRASIQRVSDTLRANLEGNVAGLAGVVVFGVLGLVNTLSLVLGLLVVPLWMLGFLTDAGGQLRAGARLLPPTWRADGWAIVRIFDRSFGAFFRGQIWIAAATGLLTYVGLRVLDFLGLPEVHYEILLAVVAGLLALIPAFGPLIAVVPWAVLGFAASVQTGAALLLVFVAVQWLVDQVVASRVSRRVVDLPPLLLVLVVVALSQLGLLWVLLAAPVTAVCRDVFRYVYGRFGDPPRPAGLLPGGRLRVGADGSYLLPSAPPLGARHRKGARRAGAHPAGAPGGATLALVPLPGEGDAGAAGREADAG